MSGETKRPLWPKLFWGAVIIWLLWAFAIQPMFFGPEYTDMPYSHFTNNVGDVLEATVAPNGRSITYIVDVNGRELRTVAAGDPTAILDQAAQNGAVVYAQPPPESMHWLAIVALTILPVLILVFFLFKLGKKNGGGLLDFGKNRARLVDPDSNKTRLSDVISNPGEHDEAKEIIDFLQRSEDYMAAKATFPRGILLAGSPGTGKTLLARAIAGEAGVPFFEIAGSEFVEMFVGVGSARVKSMFKQARAVAPSIIFIDEIDAVGQSRGAGATGGSQEQGNTLNQLLSEMDGYEGATGVLVIGATNRPEALDAALLRPGRFDRVINVTLPDVEAREKIIKLHLKDVNAELLLTDDVVQIAKGTPGFSGAELKQLINEAAILAAREKRTDLTLQDMEKSKDKVMMGAESPKKMNKDEVEKTAYHEAGHAIVGKLVPDHDSVYKVSIIPRGRALGVTMFLPEEERYSHSEEHLNSSICSLMGGRVAEELKYGPGKVSTGASSDIQRATEIARRMVTEWGFSKLGVQYFGKTDNIGSSMLSTHTLEKIEAEIALILSKNYHKAKDLIEGNRDKLDAMAAALVQHETIDENMINAIMEKDDD